MKSIPVLFCMILVTGTTASAGIMSPITYTVNTPNLPAGWSLDSGTITTDGTIGVLDVSNIEDWSLTITTPDPTTPFTFTPANSTVHDFTFGADLIASATEITLGSVGGGFPGNIHFKSSGDTERVEFRTAQTSSPVSFQITDASATPDRTGVISYATGNDTPAVIASVSSSSAVPEPSSFALLGLCVAGLALQRYRSRKPSAAGR